MINCPIFGNNISKLGKSRILFNQVAYFYGMKIQHCIAVCFILFLSVSCSQAPDEKEPSLPLDLIPEMLQNQCDEWNKGNLEGYMSYYWRSNELRFITEQKDLQGWDSIYSNYKRSFPNLEAVGRLSFSELKTYKLSDNLANVTGKWHIQRKKGDIGGKFSLICRYEDKKWVIIIDHTW